MDALTVPEPSHRRTPREELADISTPFLPDAWEEMLRACGDAVWEAHKGVVRGMREGFKNGVENVRLAGTYIAENMVAPEHEEWLTAEYDAETELGRLSEGFPPEVWQEVLGTNWIWIRTDFLISLA
ncbi:hypothetical protein CYLTODRAFT_426870 [Cylindrobasidium torrendii FP15055 ss-10]|uniref:Uncharacterized protein n=1 Tax=Cylindrobasidium torrendii FP15055 ss-10 TaxID=1314674 RepID=A0A0D7AVU1_9AGAR|nr:hypothetical protein CYLTODRAFT_426870 [Cylindrobasidium torrendii FP15055 ss-10]